MDRDKLLDIYTRTMRIARFDEQMRSVIMSGKLATLYYTVRGQELVTAAMMAAAGIVSTQATTRLKVTAQRTALTSWAEPTPTMAPVMVCVVETGMPKEEARNRVIAPLVSAQNPPTGLSLVIFWPMVLTIRQPPNSVPRAIAK